MNFAQEPDRVTSVTLGQESRLGRILGIAGVLLLLLIFTAVFYQRTYVGLASRDSMDIAQIARNVFSGNGFTTHFVRPFNIHFYSEDQRSLVELNHAPLFVYAVAGMYKVTGPSDQTVIRTSMMFLGLAVLATYFLGCILYDWRVGLLAASVFCLSAPILRTGTSGEEWVMAALWCTLLLCSLALHHKSAQAETARAAHVFAGLCGLFFALMFYTHYVFAVLLIPLTLYFVFTRVARKTHLVVFLAVGLLLMAPLVYRNTVLTGSPILGVNAWDVMADTLAFPGDTLYRSMDAGNYGLVRTILFPMDRFPSFAEKLASGSSDILSAIIPLIGIAALPFAVVGVLYKFKSPQANAVRGLIYCVLPLVTVCFAVYGIDIKAIVVFAPVGAVLASAYFLLLLQAKKLHPFFVRVLIGGFVFITAVPATVAVVWPMQVKTDPTQDFFVVFSNGKYRGPVYTDAPWVAAWRTTNIAIWVPRGDSDVWSLEAKGLPLRIIVLTPESDRFSSDEAWYMLHKVKLWREYLRDPEEGLKEILAAARLSKGKTQSARTFMRRLKRSFAISETITSGRSYTLDPLGPDDIQLIEIP